MLIEKALAKVYGSYKNLDGGRPSHGFQDLVGYPIRYINCRNERFQMILDIALKAQVPVVTFGLVHNTGKFPDDATRIRPFVRKRMLAMYSRHSYSVLSMFEHENKTYVKLRNPHGRNIMWRRFEKSAILTADERESGEFCLEISQFRRWFTEYVFFYFFPFVDFFSRTLPQVCLCMDTCRCTDSTSEYVSSLSFTFVGCLLSDRIDHVCQERHAQRPDRLRSCFG